MMSIRILKMPGDTIIEPLFKIFKNCLNCGILPHDCNKENIVPIFKKATNKASKTIVQSLFFQSVARFSNVIIHHNILKYFCDNNLISPK